jgi:hypothetical protein
MRLALRAVGTRLAEHEGKMVAMLSKVRFASAGWLILGLPQFKFLFDVSFLINHDVS